MTAKTLSEKMREVIRSTIRDKESYRIDVGTLAEIMRELGPLLEAAEGLRALCRGEMGECCDVDHYDQARAALMGEKS